MPVIDTQGEVMSLLCFLGAILAVFMLLGILNGRK